MTPGVKRFSLDHPRAVKKCRKCVLEVGCIQEGAGLDRECMEFVMAGFFSFVFFFFFSFFFGGGRVWKHPVFLNNIYNYYPNASK